MYALQIFFEKSLAMFFRRHVGNHWLFTRNCSVFISFFQISNITKHEHISMYRAATLNLQAISSTICYFKIVTTSYDI